MSGSNEHLVGIAVVRDSDLTAQSTGTTPLPVSQGIASASVSGTFVATVHLQRRFITGPSTFTAWVDITSYTTPTEENVEVGEPMQLRLFIKSGNFTSGTVTAHVGQWRV